MQKTTDRIIAPCYHCGELCNETLVQFDNKSFCCDGCKVVYDLLRENNLCTYYNLDSHAGISPKLRNMQGRFAFLDDQKTTESLIRYKDNEQVIVVFHLPQMHCSSCVWLLEHLYRLDPGVQSSRTDFLQKEITIHFRPGETSIRKIVELLTTLGYEPLLNLDSLNEVKKANPQKQRIYRIAIAGFCFANIMLMSFPEYFHIADEGGEEMQRTFSWLNLALSIPVLVYSGGEFFSSAWKGLKGRFLNIDIPLVLSILLTFGRSLFEIISGTGAGYLDSMSGIIFFMLVGRYFQEKTHYNLQFDRNYKSFFPISILIKKSDGKSESIPLPNLKVNDTMVIHSQELIPADSKLLSEDAHVDYSFVTGESRPVKIKKGDIIYAGGKQTGGAIECEVLREVSQSYLTGLWNKDAFTKGDGMKSNFVDTLARNFTIFLLLLSAVSFLVWLPINPAKGLDALTTVLIVACPCALLLSATFTNGTIIRIFSRNKCYLKNPQVIESLAKVDEIVFDKTGTITNNVNNVRFEGEELNENQLSLIYSVARHSNHPLSKALTDHLRFCEYSEAQGFRETSGMGVRAIIDHVEVKIGNAYFTGAGTGDFKLSQGSRVYVAFDDHVVGYFNFEKSFRPNAAPLLHTLMKRFKISFLSGDNSNDREALRALVSKDVEMKFEQSPEEKLEFIRAKQSHQHRVAMVGDGLNDAGALKQSDVGIAVSDDVNNFSPACDAILEGSAFSSLDKLLQLARRAQNIIKASFVMSLLYNVVGLSFAVQGNLSPVVAAILMPLSSISIILLTSGLSYLSAARLGLK